METRVSLPILEFKFYVNFTKSRPLLFQENPQIGMTWESLAEPSESASRL